MSYVDVAKKHSGSLDDLVPKLADWEKQNEAGKGGGRNWGTNNSTITTRDQAIDYYKKTEIPKVVNLPKDLQALGLQQAINTGDPWGSAMTAAGLYDQKGNGKLGVRGDNRNSKKQESLYNTNIDKINEAYRKDPKGFKERYIKAMEYHYNHAFPKSGLGSKYNTTK